MIHVALKLPTAKMAEPKRGVFGAIDGDPDACRKALAFTRVLRTRLAKEQAKLPPIGIGIHHGRVFCGIVGDADRQEFTVLGDVVNVASRLEALTRTDGGALLISDAVLAMAGEPHGTLAGARRRAPARS